MRWWIHTDPPNIMSVDNASVSGMNFSSLLATQPDIWMVQWTEGKGEIERQDVVADANLNGLRETFIDITPYAPLFQQFLTLMQAKALLLPQAKKVQIDLIGLIFDSKRQLPFHYPVAAGDYYWDATDATLFASTVPAIQNSIAKINEVIAALNAKMPALSNTLTSVATQADAVSVQSNSLRDQINIATVATANSVVNQVNNNIVARSIGDMTMVQAKCLTATIDTGPAPNGQGTVEVAAPGLAPNSIVQVAYVPENQFASLTIAFAGVSGSGGTWTNINNVTASNISWIPVGSSMPVNVTPAEQAAILNGIAARTNTLITKKNVKIAAVNALTTIAAVIAYDVTTGW